MIGRRAIATLATVGVTVGACLAPAPQPAPSGSVPASTVAGSAEPTATDEPVLTPVPGELTELARPWMPPWSGPNAPPEIAERPGLRFCGVELPPPAFDRAVRECFLREVDQGRNIEFARIDTTDGGDPIAKVFAFEPVEPPAFVILTDSTQDALRAPAWTVAICRSIVNGDPETMFRFGDCVNGPTYPLIP